MNYNMLIGSYLIKFKVVFIKFGVVNLKTAYPRYGFVGVDVIKALAWFSTKLLLFIVVYMD